MGSRKSCFNEKLQHFFELTRDEQEALATLERDELELRAGEAVYNEGDVSSELYVVKSGWLYSFRNMESGQRQVVQLRHPGDVCGTHDLILNARSVTLVALEDCVVCPFPQQCLRDLIVDAPRVSLLLQGLAALDQVLLVDVLQAIARTSAMDRVLHLLLHLYHRLKITNVDSGQVFRLPVTQSVVGDMLGLTNVTVSKAMSELENRGLIRRQRNTVEFLELEKAMARIDYRDRFGNLDLDWLRVA